MTNTSWPWTHQLLEGLSIKYDSIWFVWLIFLLPWPSLECQVDPWTGGKTVFRLFLGVKPGTVKAHLCRVINNHTSRGEETRQRKVSSRLLLVWQWMYSVERYTMHGFINAADSQDRGKAGFVVSQQLEKWWRLVQRPSALLPWSR